MAVYEINVMLAGNSALLAYDPVEKKADPATLPSRVGLAQTYVVNL